MLKSQVPELMLVAAVFLLLPLALPLLWRGSVTDSVTAPLQRRLVRGAAVAYLVVAFGWTGLALADADPLEVGPRIRLLTAVHFFYAGFAASLLTAELDARRHVPLVIKGCVVGGPAVVAAGFVSDIRFQALGALVLTVGLAGVATLTLLEHANALLVFSSLCVLAGMTLAMSYALANALGWPVPHLDIDAMARTHGLLNGVGFSLAGVAGRHLSRRAARPRAAHAPTHS